MTHPLQTYTTVVTFFFSLLVIGQNEALFDKATEAYNKGAYQEAITYYEEILGNGQHSPSLYFNMGNAYYKKNEIAPSIYFYEKALLLKPKDPEILNNLRYARNMTLDAISPLPQTDIQKFYERLVFALSLDNWTYLGVFFALLFVIAYIFFLGARAPNRKRLALFGSFIALLIALLSNALAYLQQKEYQQDQPAIIFAREIQIRSEPNRESSAVFLLHEGSKVHVRDSLDTWRKIELADGQIGWIPENSLRILKEF